MEDSNKNAKDRRTACTTTTRDEKGHEQEGKGNEATAFNPFAKAPRVIRTPPKGPRQRTDSCLELKLPFGKTRGMDEGEKRKRTETDSVSPGTLKGKEMERTHDNDDVFVVEGFLSPEAKRETKKMREQGSRSTAATWEELDEFTEESAMSTGLRQLASRIETMAGDLSYMARKNVNTKVEIKKLSRQLDLMSSIASGVLGHIGNMPSGSPFQGVFKGVVRV